MPRMSLPKVAEAWKKNQRAESYRGDFWTDGHNLYDRHLLLGRTYKGYKLSLNVRKPFFLSNTTSKRAGYAARWADRIIDPIYNPRRTGWSAPRWDVWVWPEDWELRWDQINKREIALYTPEAQKLIEAAQADGWIINRHGLISNPGKFEWEQFAILTFYDMMMEGAFEEEDTDENWGDGLWEFVVKASELPLYGLEHWQDTGSFYDRNPERDLYIYLRQSTDGRCELSCQAQSAFDRDDEEEYEDEYE